MHPTHVIDFIDYKIAEYQKKHDINKSEYDKYKAEYDAKWYNKLVGSKCKTCTPRMIPEKSRKHVNKYRQSNRERYLSLHRLHMFARRNNIKIKSDGTVTDDFLRFVYSQTTCCWCNNEIQPKDRTLEHIIELSSG